MASHQSRVRGPPSSISSDDDLLDIQHTGTTNAGGSEYGINDGGGVENGHASNTRNSTWMFGDEIPGLGQYEDFHTIDWQRDIARDRMRHR